MTTCTQQIYEAFLADEKAKMLFHGHSYTANPIGCAAALANLDLFDTGQPMKDVERIENLHNGFASEIKEHKRVKNLRQQGTIIAIEIETGEGTSYLSSIRDKAYNYFIGQKIILRPLGNVIYILPPYCISNADLQIVYAAIISFLDSL
jgi:adenosylmethionine-8-amino-7-oxononanoate aminotransferase